MKTYTKPTLEIILFQAVCLPVFRDVHTAAQHKNNLIGADHAVRMDPFPVGNEFSRAAIKDVFIHSRIFTPNIRFSWLKKYAITLN